MPTHKILLIKIDDADSIKILAIKIDSINSFNQNYFIYTIQFDIEESKTDAKAMKGSNAFQ